ncbi:MAG: SPOR domain-containing protein [Balneolaceae bacterium]|nr:SPOR domain-containing protein [Balneolaceae bacterium]
MEILGGDLQGSAFGSYSNNATNFLTDGLRWRYVIRESNILSQFMLGQTTTDGIESRSFLGVRATNDPIEPRYIFEEFEIEGDAPPESEVELYFDDALYDFQEIDRDGRYRFLAPLTYGSSRLRIRIYDPSGGVRERAQRIQVPFSFLQTGEVNYHLNAGRLQDPLFGTTEEGYLAQGDIGYGISNWLTQKVGVEYFSEFSNQSPQFVSSTSARLFREYLLNIDLAPNSFYRVSGSAIYPSSASWDVEYTYFEDTTNPLYNTLGNDYEINGNFYLPINLLNIPSNFRLTTNHSVRGNNTQTRYRADFNTRFNRLNIRLSYRDTEIGALDLSPSVESEIGASLTYFVGQNPGLPEIFRGWFLRGQAEYNPNFDELVQVEGQISRDILQNGRIQASYSRNFLGNFDIMSFGITFDFNKTRSSTTVRRSPSGTFFSQNLLGSFGYDQYGQDLVLSNRQQVGRAATSVRLFVDNNNNGTYDSGDEAIEDNAIRIGRSGVSRETGEGIVHISQLQAYNRINMEINKSMIRNPMLVPEIEKFSIVTDPNQYKPVEVPFYMSGIISGTVTRAGTGVEGEPVPGLRVYLDSDSTSHFEEMRTFNDGTFYAYEVPPGPYSLYIDQQQLDILDAISEPDTMKITIEPKPEGDFLEGLEFKIIPKGAPAEVITRTTSARADTGFYQVQIASFVLDNNAIEAVAEAEQRFNQPFVIKHNPKRNLYAVRTLPINGLRASIRQLIDIDNSQQTTPALVVLDSKKITENGDNTYSVQIGAFSTRERARRFMKTSRENLDLNLSIVQDPEDRLYKVRTAPFPTNQMAEKELQQIRRKTLFSDAFIPPNATILYDGTDYEYRVRIEGITRIDVEAQLDRAASAQSIPGAAVSEGPEENIVWIENLPTWPQALMARNLLSDISGAGKPVIMLVEK